MEIEQKKSRGNLDNKLNKFIIGSGIGGLLVGTATSLLTNEPGYDHKLTEWVIGSVFLFGYIKNSNIRNNFHIAGMYITGDLIGQNITQLLKQYFN